MSTYPFDFASFGNTELILQLYEAYLENPNSVDSSWQHFFQGVAFAADRNGVGSVAIQGGDVADLFRRYGHLIAKSNPFRPSQGCRELDGYLEQSGGEIEKLKRVYCGTIGFEFMHCDRSDVRSEIINRIEHSSREVSQETRRRTLDGMVRAEMLEDFIHRSYAGAKRFSLEGGEPLIPMLWEMGDIGAEYGVTHAVVGMAHRGRLNVLANVMTKPMKDIFHEFEPTYKPPFENVSGDVKYHLGYERTYETRGKKKLWMKLMPNPSHLESVNAPTTGYCRAMQENLSGTKGVLPVIIHGDAAIAGQGVVYETLQLSQVQGYSVGGSLHVIINNQVGFTATPEETKSTRYCSDIAKAFGYPVFHVNAEDADGCVFAMELAIILRQKFDIDVFIELNCYRKYGHNEGDEPRFTNPKLYNFVSQRKSPLACYEEYLQANNLLTASAIQECKTAFKAELEQALVEAKNVENEKAIVAQKESLIHIDTKIEQHKLVALAQKLTEVPTGHKVHPKIARLIEDRVKMAQGEIPIDFGAAETFAFASLLDQGISIRLSGQDCCRATFSHRHAALIDQETEKKYIPLAHISPQARFQVYNSILSEEAVVGYEWGYSFCKPNDMTIWEAQYGDFANGAQVMIDQYIVSSEQKWNAPTSLTLLLPHGYEGSGPEHSSARLERFLQLCACDNIRVAVPSTSAQYFHLLRMQAMNPVKKPLIVYTPKALLRYGPALSGINQFIKGEFSPVIDSEQDPAKVTKILLCSGKVFYNLIEKNTKDSIAIIRVELLYPFPKELLLGIIQRYSSAKEIIWVQEEHQNMGAWHYVFPLLREYCSANSKIGYAGRAPSSSTAAGSSLLHNQELERFISEALA